MGAGEGREPKQGPPPLPPGRIRILSCEKKSPGLLHIQKEVVNHPGFAFWTEPPPLKRVSTLPGGRLIYPTSSGKGKPCNHLGWVLPVSNQLSPVQAGSIQGIP